MKIFKYIYYFLLCHLFPNKIHKGALGKQFVISFVKENDRWYADVAHWPGHKWQLEMVGGADDLLDFLNPRSLDPDKVTLLIGSSPEGLLTKIDENSKGATYRDSLTGRKVWLCNVSKWAFGRHPGYIPYRQFRAK